MNYEHYSLQGNDYSDISFSQKIAITFELLKRHGLTISLFYLATISVTFIIAFVGILIFIGPNVLSGPLGAGDLSIISILFLLFLYVATIICWQFFTLGITSLVLKYVDGKEPEEGIIGQILMPWNNFLPIILCGVVWFGIFFVFGIIIAVVSLIPILGILINLMGSFIMYLISLCIYFYIADVERPDITEAVVQPIKLFFANIITWLAVLGIVVFIYFGGTILLCIIAAIIPQAAVIYILFILFALAFFAAATVFSFFLSAVTYRQITGDSDAMSNVATQVF